MYKDDLYKYEKFMIFKFQKIEKINMVMKSMKIKNFSKSCINIIK